MKKSSKRKRIIQGAAVAGLVLAGGAGVYAAHKTMKSRAAENSSPPSNAPSSSKSAPIKTTLSLNPAKDTANRREESTQKLIKQTLKTQVSTPPVLSPLGKTEETKTPRSIDKIRRIRKAKQIAGLATVSTKVGGLRSKRELPSRKIKTIDAENKGKTGKKGYWGLQRRATAPTKSAKASAAKVEAQAKLAQNLTDRESAEKTLKVLPALPKVRTKRRG